MGLPIRTVAIMYALAGIAGLAYGMNDDSVMSGVIAWAVLSALASLIWALSNPENALTGLDMRPGVLLTHAGALVVSGLFTFWLVSGLNFPVVESTITGFTFVLTTYYTFLLTEPFAKSE